VLEQPERRAHEDILVDDSTRLDQRSRTVSVRAARGFISTGGLDARQAHQEEGGDRRLAEVVGQGQPFGRRRNRAIPFTLPDACPCEQGQGLSEQRRSLEARKPGRTPRELSRLDVALERRSGDRGSRRDPERRLVLPEHVVEHGSEDPHPVHATPRQAQRASQCVLRLLVGRAAVARCERPCALGKSDAVAQHPAVMAGRDREPESTRRGDGIGLFQQAGRTRCATDRRRRSARSTS
jgi:hypothetical protein